MPVAEETNPFRQSFLSTTVEKPDEKKNKKVVDKQKTT